MSTEWTVERLEALPEGTVIEVLERGIIRWQYVKVPGKWEMVGEELAETTRSVLLTDHDSIRVVSVPIDALLSDETCNAGADVLSPTGEWWAQSQARYVLRAAVAHVTGGAE